MNKNCIHYVLHSRASASYLVVVLGKNFCDGVWVVSDICSQVYIVLCCTAKAVTVNAPESKMNFPLGKIKCYLI